MGMWAEYYNKGRKLVKERKERLEYFNVIDLAKQQAKEIRLLKIELKQQNPTIKDVDEFFVLRKHAKNKKKNKINTIPSASNLQKCNLTTEDFANMLAKQKGVCAICEKVNTNNRNLHVDHCHKTAQVRSLLCNKCNSMLGMARDNPEILEKAAQYLKIHQKRAKIKLTG